MLYYLCRMLLPECSVSHQISQISEQSFASFEDDFNSTPKMFITDIQEATEVFNGLIYVYYSILSHLFN